MLRTENPPNVWLGSCRSLLGFFVLFAGKIEFLHDALDDWSEIISDLGRRILFVQEITHVLHIRLGLFFSRIFDFFCLFSLCNFSSEKISTWHAVKVVQGKKLKKRKAKYNELRLLNTTTQSGPLCGCTLSRTKIPFIQKFK